MTRAISTATLAALEADTVYTIFFAELLFDTGSPENILRMSTWIGDITWNSVVWTGAGDMAAISFSEGIGVEPFALRVGLSGIDSDLITAALSTDYYQRPIILYMGSMGADGALVEDPSIVFSGFIKSMEMTMANPKGDAISLVAESEVLWFSKTANVRYTDNQLQSEFSGDVGLEYLPQVIKRKVVWRGVSQTNLPGSFADRRGD